MVRGWFIGGFQPNAFQTDSVEVGVKKYRAGDQEKSHHHKIATEVTVVVSGIIQINSERYSDGDIITVEPHESASFKSITDSVTVVVKIPGAPNDKYED